MDNLRLWHKFLESVKQEIDSGSLKTYFLKCTLKSNDGETIIISAPSAFIQTNLVQKYLPLIESAFEKLLGKKVKIDFIVKETDAEPQTANDAFFQALPQAPTSSLNPKFTLENFVVGPSNNVAYAAAQAVAANPGTSYNPLFLYGGTGVGKTHLMLGIGNAILKKTPGAKINYCSSEKFMNDYVEAIKSNRMGDLRKKYRAADVLLIDDIQFFSGREGTQEEFFHTFNELQGRNSQMVLTSDRSPQEIEKIEDRLKSRFAGGLMLDIQAPDFDTRVAILKAKSAEAGVVIPEDSLKLIAKSLDSNIRELEGKLTQIMQVLKLKNLEPNAENISQFLSSSPNKPLVLDQKKVLHSICGYFDINMKDLTGPKRQKELVLPRHLAMYILSEELKLTVEKIGSLLGGRDHTTVMHARDKMKKLIQNDREVQRIFIELKQKMTV